MHELADKLFAVPDVPGVDGLADLLPVNVKIVLGGCQVRRVLDPGGKVSVPLLEGGELAAEGVHPAAAGCLRQSSDFEREEVPLDGVIGAAHLTRRGVELGLQMITLLTGMLPAGDDRLLDEVGLQLGVQQAGQDRLVQLLGGEAFSVAAGLAVPVPGDSSVIRAWLRARHIGIAGRSRR